MPFKAGWDREETISPRGWLLAKGKSNANSPILFLFVTLGKYKKRSESHRFVGNTQAELLGDSSEMRIKLPQDRAGWSLMSDFVTISTIRSSRYQKVSLQKLGNSKIFKMNSRLRSSQPALFPIGPRCQGRFLYFLKSCGIITELVLCSTFRFRKMVKYWGFQQFSS